MNSAALIGLFHAASCAATCGDLPKLSDTVAERSTGVPLLSAAESMALCDEISKKSVTFCNIM